MLSKKVTIKNATGLHMRPAGVFSKTILKHKSSVKFVKDGSEYDGRSMISVLSAAVKCGNEIELRVEGEDEEVCMNAVVEAIESGLGEG